MLCIIDNVGSDSNHYGVNAGLAQDEQSISASEYIPETDDATRVLPTELKYPSRFLG